MELAKSINARHGSKISEPYGGRFPPCHIPRGRQISGIAKLIPASNGSANSNFCKTE